MHKKSSSLSLAVGLSSKVVTSYADTQVARKASMVKLRLQMSSNSLKGVG